MIKLADILKQLLLEEKAKRDRCLRIADRKFDKPSAYKSGAVVRCRQGKIWKDIKEDENIDNTWDEAYDEHVDMLKIFIEQILDMPYDKSNINLGHSDGEEEDMIYINSKIYGENPTLFTTYHDNNIGELINYEYESYKPIDLSPDEIEDILNDFKLKKLGLKENQIQSILDKAKTYKIPYSKVNQELKKDWIPTWKIEYDNNLAKINELVARHLLYRIAEDLVGGVNEIEFKNESKSPTNHFQMTMYLGNVILYTLPFIYVDNNHKIISDRTKIELLNEDYDTLYTLKEDELTEAKKETLRTWFKRKGTPGKEGGWVDCNTCRDGKCKACGRKEGEKRSKYPSCRPTPAQCKTPGKGKKWGKTK